MQALAFRATLAWLAAASIMHLFGAPLIEQTLPLQEALVEQIGEFSADLDLVQTAHGPKIELIASADQTLVYHQVAADPGTTWRVRTELNNATQQIVIALAFAAALPVAGTWRRVRFMAMAAVAGIVVALATLPTILAAGVYDVLRTANASFGTPAPPTLLQTFDLTLNNGGIWMLSLVSVALLYLACGDLKRWVARGPAIPNS